RHPLAVDLRPPVEARLTLGVQLSERDPAAELRLGRALAPREPHAAVAAPASELVPLGVDLVCLPDRGARLVVEHRGLALEGAGAEHGALFDEVADRATEGGPGLAVDQVVVGNDEG